MKALMKKFWFKHVPTIIITVTVVSSAIRVAEQSLTSIKLCSVVSLTEVPSKAGTEFALSHVYMLPTQCWSNCAAGVEHHRCNLPQLGMQQQKSPNMRPNTAVYFLCSKHWLIRVECLAQLHQSSNTVAEYKVSCNATLWYITWKHT